MVVLVRCFYHFCTMGKRIVVGVGGASGAIYTKRLLDRLQDLSDQYEEVGVVMTRNAYTNWQLEIGEWKESVYPFAFFENQDFNAPFASGSARYDTMIVCPCSMGLLGRIASGVSNDLISRAADVVLKERRKLILVARETPLSLIHLRNMTTLTEAGAIVCPAVPSFYAKPTSIEELVDTVIERVLDLAGLEVDAQRWGS